MVSVSESKANEILGSPSPTILSPGYAAEARGPAND